MSSSEVATKDLDPPILSQKIRINPQTFQGNNIAMRLELSGCSQDEQRYCKYMALASFCESVAIRVSMRLGVEVRAGVGLLFLNNIGLAHVIMVLIT